MKKRIKKLTALMLALAVSVMFLPAVSADSPPPPHNDPSEYDQMMLTAFWQQEAYDGMNNGEAVYDIHLAPGGYLEYPPPTYGGGYYTHLLYFVNSGEISVIDSLGFYYDLEGYDGIMPGMKLLPYVNVKPDLYGTLDLHGTSIHRIYSPEAGQTHITGLELHDCPHLTWVQFKGQQYCESLNALNSPIYLLSALDGVFKNIDFSTRAFEKDVHIEAFGNGSVGAYYNYLNDKTDFTLFAYPESESFVGWYKDDKLITEELSFDEIEGGSFVACFGGDADSDGDITTTDALLSLRTALGLEDGRDADQMMDIDCDGDITTTDALLILRFAMGIR